MSDSRMLAVISQAEKRISELAPGPNRVAVEMNILRGCLRDLKMINEEPVEELTEAIRFTAEYANYNHLEHWMLPPIEGWSWYDALKKYAPEKAAVFEEQYSWRQNE